MMPTCTAPDWCASLLSEVSEDFLSNPFPVLGESLRISLRLAADAPVSRIFLRTVLAGESRLRVLHRAGSSDGWSWYAVDLTISQHRVAWHFVLECADGDYLVYNRLGVCRYHAAADWDFSVLAGLECPRWVRSAVFYQIYPDRFHCATIQDAVAENEYHYDGWPSRRIPWTAKPKSWQEVHCLDFYGGDLDGIMAKIPYLMELGVNALYLNPIFEASSTHRYDCIDYFRVDPHLGGDDALAALSSALHSQDIKLVLDVSINHTGSEHHWLKKALADPSAPERSFYYFDRQGRPQGWEGVPTLPQLDYASPELCRRIWQDEDAVVRRWLKAPFAIDGWRFDVGNFTGRHGADDHNHRVFSAVRQSVKEVSAEAYILGECWIDAQEYLDGRSWDAAMNYQASARVIRRFLGCRDRFTDPEERLSVPVPPLSGQELAAAICHYFARLPSQLAFVQFNLIDSHDIYRLHNFSGLVNDALLRGALVLLYLLPGAPCIYYGDEIALDGDMSTNEGCRYPMEWDSALWNQERLQLYRRLNQLKRQEAALHYGALRFLHAGDDTVVVARIGLQRSFIGVFSRAARLEDCSVDLRAIGSGPLLLTDVFTGSRIKTSEGKVALPAGQQANTLYMVETA